MPKAIPEGLTQEHILLALQDLDAGIEHPFGPPIGFELVHSGDRYPPKAVVGIAFRHLTGNILSHEEFSGGDPCPDCGGSGRYVGLNAVEDCRACEGTGRVI